MRVKTADRKITGVKNRLRKTHDTACQTLKDKRRVNPAYEMVLRRFAFPYPIMQYECTLCSLKVSLKEAGKTGETWVINPYTALENTHPSGTCRGEVCTMHSPSDHHMRAWPIHYRFDRNIFERICQHAIGHPDPDTLLGSGDDGTHGCDGCCAIHE